MPLHNAMPFVRQTEVVEPFDVFLPGQGLLSAGRSRSGSSSSSKGSDMKGLYPDNMVISQFEAETSAARAALQREGANKLVNKYNMNIQEFQRNEPEYFKKQSSLFGREQQAQAMKAQAQWEREEFNKIRKKASDEGQLGKLMTYNNALVYEKDGQIGLANPKEKVEGRNYLTVGQYYDYAASQYTAFQDGQYAPRWSHEVTTDNAFYDFLDSELDEAAKVFQQQRGKGEPGAPIAGSDMNKQMLDGGYIQFIEPGAYNAESMLRRVNPKTLIEKLGDEERRDLVNQFHAAEKVEDFDTFVQTYVGNRINERLAIEPGKRETKAIPDAGLSPVVDKYNRRDVQPGLWNTEWETTPEMMKAITNDHDKEVLQGQIDLIADGSPEMVAKTAELKEKLGDKMSDQDVIAAARQALSKEYMEENPSFKRIYNQHRDAMMKAVSLDPDMAGRLLKSSTASEYAVQMRRFNQADWTDTHLSNQLVDGVRLPDGKVLDQAEMGQIPQPFMFHVNSMVQNFITDNGYGGANLSSGPLGDAIVTKEWLKNATLKDGTPMEEYLDDKDIEYEKFTINDKLKEKHANVNYWKDMLTRLEVASGGKINADTKLRIVQVLSTDYLIGKDKVRPTPANLGSYYIPTTTTETQQ